MTSYGLSGPTGPYSTRKPNQFGDDPQAALQGLMSAAPATDIERLESPMPMQFGAEPQAAPQPQAKPLTGIPQINTPAESAQILGGSQMMSNASAANQGTMGGFGSMQELRRAAAMPEMQSWQGTDHFGTPHAGGNFGVARAPGSQGYAKAILDGINSGAASLRKQQDVVADHAFQRQFGRPFANEEAAAAAQRVNDATKSRLAMQQEPANKLALEEEASRGGAAITARGGIEQELIRSKAATDAANIKAGLGFAGSDEYMKGIWAAAEGLQKALYGPFDKNSRPIEGPQKIAAEQLLARMYSILSLGHGQAAGAQAPQGPSDAELTIPHGMPGHQHSVMEDMPQSPIPFGGVNPGVNQGVQVPPGVRRPNPSYGWNTPPGR